MTPLSEEDETDTEEELRLRLIEYATTKGRAEALGDRMRAGERAFHREGGTVDLPPKGGDPDALAAAWSKVLADCVQGAPKPVYVGGQIEASDFVPARW